LIEKSTNETKSERKEEKSFQTDKEKVQDFQRKLYQKAKQEKGFRFYVLYDKVRSMTFLRESYRRVKANKGRAGIDKKTFEEIENEGVEQYLQTIQKELETRSYKPSPVLKVYIPKANGGKRPLGIPTIKDRIVQMSCKMVIEPIFEADLEDTNYGFRPKKSASQAIEKIKENLQEGLTEIYDADIKSYFDTIPHDKLMIVISKRISDKNILHLIKMWLKSPKVENGKISGGKKNKVGTPQGGVISPLLSNIYLNLVDKIVNKVGGTFKRIGIKIIRYADDFVLMGKQIPKEIIQRLKAILENMELELNEEKSKKINVEKEQTDFLGFTIRYNKDIHGRSKRYWNIMPSKKAEKKIRETISELLHKSNHYLPQALVKEVNQKIRGWINYYTIPKVSYPAMSQRKLRHYLRTKLCTYYRRKSQRKSRLYCQDAFGKLVSKYGLIDPTKMFKLQTLVNA
jgi:group II intron reverse transcriptase/maturase